MEDYQCPVGTKARINTFEEGAVKPACNTVTSINKDAMTLLPARCSQRFGRWTIAAALIISLRT